MKKNVKLMVNGKEVPLRDFPERVLQDIIMALISNLKLEEKPENIIIELNVDRGKERIHSG